MAISERNLEEAKVALTLWLTGLHPEASGVRIDNMSVPSIGFSGEIILLDASWKAGGSEQKQGLAIRVEPTTHQLFLDTRFQEQFLVQEALAASDVLVAPTVRFESDESVLGARFYALAKIGGDAYDVQTNPESKVLDLSAGRQQALCLNFLEALAGIHRVDPHHLQFLDQPDLGSTPMDQQMRYYREYFDWCRGEAAHPVIEAGFRWMEQNRPPTMPPTGLVWGDARMGNLLWDDQQACTAVLDWEMCSLGPAEADLAWFLFQDHATPRSMAFPERVSWAGSPVPPGIPAVDAIVSYYEQALGRAVQDLDFFMMWAALRTAVIVTRLTPLLEEIGVPPLPNVGETAIAEQLGMVES